MSKYELELKKILSGEEELIEKATRTLEADKRMIYKKLLERPFGVVRGAGSLGIDILAMRGERYFPIEIKSSKKSPIYFSDHGNDEQAEEFLELSRKAKFPLLYAFRLKGIRGEKWRIFQLDRKVSEKFYPWIPTAQRTSHGNRKLEFSEGLWLSNFLAMILGNE